MPTQPLNPGLWQISAPGGADIAAFDQPVTLPPHLRWIGREQLTAVPRNRNLVLRWDPSGYGTGEIMHITLARPPGGIICRAYAWQGEAIIPHSLLARIQPIERAAYVTLRVQPHPAARPVFHVARPDGTTAPVVINYSFSEVREVAIQ